MRALSVRQPWAELILLGRKTVEARSKRTALRERVYLYASMIRIEPEQEARVARQFGINVEGLSRGVLVGTVEILGCRRLAMSDSGAECYETDDGTGYYAWVLDRPERFETPLKPSRQPLPMFFNPF
jgi:hypothetical protein